MMAAAGSRHLRKLAVIGNGTAAPTAASNPAQFRGGRSAGRSWGSRATSGRALAAPSWPIFRWASREEKVLINSQPRSGALVRALRYHALPSPQVKARAGPLG